MDIWSKKLWRIMLLTLDKAIQLLKAGEVDKLTTRDFPIREYCGIANLTVGGKEYTLILEQDSSRLRSLWKKPEQPHQGLII